MLESKIEEALRLGVEAVGGLCEKHVSPGKVGVPDRLITWPWGNYCLPYGAMELVELKKPGEKVKPNSPQDRDHKRRYVRGVKVTVLSTPEQVYNFLLTRKNYAVRRGWINS